MLVGPIFTLNRGRIVSLMSMAAVALCAAQHTKAAQFAAPKDFQQVGPGVARPDGVLHFDYSWKSTSGNLADLSHCAVGENVIYPGYDPNNLHPPPFLWPSPPYSGSTQNPTILWVPATDGKAQDNHYHVGFLTPYMENAFNASQDYNFKCTYPYVFGRTFRKNITIARSVIDSTGRGCYGYTVTKFDTFTLSDASASVSPLPNVAKTACQSQANVAQRVSDFKNSGYDIGMSVSPPEGSVGLNEPIFFDLTVFNRRAEMVGLDLGLNRKANLQLTIRDPAGGVITRTLSSAGFGRLGEVSLAPGGAFMERLLLNEWYEFRQTGTYRILVTLLDGSFATSGTASSNRPSTEFSVQIRPRDSAHLELVCEELADAAIAGATLEESMEAANALSYVPDDPVAVPSLVRVLQHGSSIAPYAVAGLGRIGSPAAIAALVATQDDPDEEVRAAVRFTLGALQGRARGASGPVD